MMAATLALKTFTKDRTGILVLLRIVNTTAVAYINNQGESVGTTGSPDPQSMDVVSREEHPHPCPTSPRLLEYGS